MVIMDKPEKFTALLENIRSLYNVGSIFRSADGAGFTQLYLCGFTGYPPRKEITKTSLGAQESVLWQYRKNTQETVDILKKQGVFMVALEKQATSILLNEAISKKLIRTPMCLVVGNEVTGVSPQVLTACDIIVSLSMSGIKESLNVAVAFGIASYFIKHGVD